MLRSMSIQGLLEHRLAQLVLAQTDTQLYYLMLCLLCSKQIARICMLGQESEAMQIHYELLQRGHSRFQWSQHYLTRRLAL
jgi:hypothetical protein